MRFKFDQDEESKDEDGKKEADLFPSIDKGKGGKDLLAEINPNKKNKKKNKGGN